MSYRLPNLSCLFLHPQVPLRIQKLMQSMYIIFGSESSLFRKMTCHSPHTLLVALWFYPTGKAVLGRCHTLHLSSPYSDKLQTVRATRFSWCHPWFSCKHETAKYSVSGSLRAIEGQTARHGLGSWFTRLQLGELMRIGGKGWESLEALSRGPQLHSAQY